MNDTPLAIEVRGLRKSYGDKHAVDGIDLDVARGEIFAVLGPNGAGKTTAIEILEGHRKRDAGTVSVLGEDPATADLTWLDRIGVVLQTSNSQAEITVKEAVSHFSGYYSRPRDPREVIEAVGLTEKAGTRIRHLSGGQRRRLDVALGIIGTPELLFLDEPTTGFDPQARRDFWELIDSLRDSGTTIVLTTHYLDEAEHLADRLAVIKDGKVMAVSTPAELGGRRARQAIVSWIEDGQVRAIQTDTPTAVAAELSARLAPSGGEVPGLAIVRPSLEDVYLSMIGEQTNPVLDNTTATRKEILA